MRPRRRRRLLLLLLPGPLLNKRQQLTNDDDDDDNGHDDDEDGRGVLFRQIALYLLILIQHIHSRPGSKNLRHLMLLANNGGVCVLILPANNGGVCVLIQPANNGGVFVLIQPANNGGVCDHRYTTRQKWWRVCSYGQNPACSLTF